MKQSWVLIFLTVFTIHYSLLTGDCFAEEPQPSITADSLEFDEATSTYTAKGSVKVQKENMTLQAKQMRYNEKTSDFFAEGDVVYEDNDISLKAEKAEYNIETKKGTFYNAEIVSKKESYHVSSPEVEKRGENEYFAGKASVTTCDAPMPAWCFRGKNIDLIIGDRVKAKDVTFLIKDVPVFYTPYIWAPVITERKTGLLIPEIGYSKTKGLFYRQPFFWAISENRDATLVLDWYSKRGFGEGLEYRYLDIGGIKGSHWFYYLYDSEMNKGLYELRSIHEERGDRFSAYLNLNLLNEKRFYREYSRERYERVKRFAESTGEISIPMDNSRLYLNAQYLIDFRPDAKQSTVLQRLPEAGYTIHPQKIGPIVFSLASSVSNFWREKNPFGQRLDIYPRFSHSFGDSVVIFQSLGLRETAYSLHRLHGNDNEEYSKSVYRTNFDYNIITTTRFVKHYDSFTHVIEPSIGYGFIPNTKRYNEDMPLFDSTELYSRQSAIEAAVLNRFIDRRGEFLTLRLSESYNFYNGDRPFSPLKLEAAFKRQPVHARGDISYDSHNGNLASVNSDVKIDLSAAAISFGERYNRANDIMFYSFGIDYSFSRTLSTEVKLWYDAKGGGVRDITWKMRYQKQCWAVSFVFNKKPDDYSFFITFDLLGIGSLKV